MESLTSCDRSQRSASSIPHSASAIPFDGQARVTQWRRELVVHLRAPRIHSRIQKLQPHLSFLLRSRFADPYHVALRNIQWVFVCDDFDNLSVFQSESP